MAAGEHVSTDDPIVVDLDSPDDSGAPPAASAEPSAGAPRPWRTAGAVLAVVGVLAVGIFLGYTHANNSAANQVRVFAGDVTFDSMRGQSQTWQAGITVINDGSRPVEVVGFEIPGYDVTTDDDSPTVAAGSRSTVNLTIITDCDVVQDEPDETPPLTLTVRADDTEHTLDTTTRLAPPGAADILRAQCRAQPSLAASTTVETVSVDPAAPAEALAARIDVRTARSEDTSAEIIGVRSLIPGFALTATDLPAPLGSRSSTTFLNATWTVDACEAATRTTTDARQRPTVAILVRDGSVDTEIQGTVSTEVAFQLGLLAASECAP